MFTDIDKREIALVVGFYCFMALNYYVVLSIDQGIYHHYRGVAINHLLKAILSFPIWWLLLRSVSLFTMWRIMVFHLIGLPLFTGVWVFLYYTSCDYLGLYRLEGSRIVWDFYLTALFYIIQFGSFHLYMYYQRLREQEVLAVHLGKLTLQSELTALKAQLNPHFLYNVFNTINAAIPKTAKPARDMVNKLSDLFRYQLKASREDLVQVQEELTFIRSYLELEKERFGERLQYEFEVDATAQDAMILPMILQPLVENSVKHGLSSILEGGEIKLRIVNAVDRLIITVSDTGKGIDEEMKANIFDQGIGLRNTRERLKKMYGSDLELLPNTPRGLVVKFSIPQKGVR